MLSSAVLLRGCVLRPTNGAAAHVVTPLARPLSASAPSHSAITPATRRHGGETSEAYRVTRTELKS
eukprot:636291-Pleurochrysis_carterae.AAC.3